MRKQSIGKQTLQWKPNILKPLENKALGTKHCSGNQTFYCSISQNTCLKKVCISPVSDASASARGVRARCAEAPSMARQHHLNQTQQPLLQLPFKEWYWQRWPACKVGLRCPHRFTCCSICVSLALFKHSTPV